MKLRRLELRAFGPFSGVTLDLSGPDGRLHLIHGRNEAGKSSTLRALRGLLFGIPHVTPDAHVHPMRDLRIGAVLQDGSRGTVEVVRRKARKNALLDMGTEAPVDPSVLTSLLGGMDESLFNAMYGLDHESLRRGGEALLRGEGELGATLLDAGLGGAGIRRVLTSLDAEADALFLPHGKKPLLNQALRELSEHKKAVREVEVSAEGWHAQKGALDDLRRELSALDAQVRERTREKHRLERLRDVMGPLQRLHVLRGQRADLGEVPTLSEDAMAARTDAERARDAAASDIQKLTEQVRRLEAQLARLQVPGGLVDVGAEVIQDLSDRLGSHRRAQAEVPQLQARLRHLEEDAQALRARVRPAAQPEEGHHAGLPSGLAERVRELAQQRAGLTTSLEQANRTLTSLREQHAAADAQVRRDVGLDDTVDLASLTVPLEEEIDGFAQGFAEWADAERALREAQDDLAGQAIETERRLDAERRQGDVPTEDELADARGARDALWERVRREGVEQGPVEAFERATAHADGTADRLRREAARVASVAQLRAEQEAQARRRRDLEAREQALETRGRELRERWAQAWAASGIRPQSPETMRSWRRAFEAMRQRAAEVREAAAEARRWEQALEAWGTQWAGCMEGLGLSPEATVTEATAVVDDLRTLAAKMEAATEQRRRLEALEREARELQGRADALVEAHAPDLAPRSLEGRVEALVERWHRVQSERDERRSREEELRAAREQLADAQRRHDEARAALEALMERAGVEDLEALRQVEEKVRHVRDLDAQIERLEAHLLDRGQGATLQQLQAEAEGLEADEVHAHIEALHRELESLDERRKQTAQRLGSTEKGLQVLEARSAAHAAEEEAEALARVKSLAHRTVRLRLASALLRRELERYRDEHQGPVLARARELFPHLTLGAYHGLKVGYGTDDEPVLVCVRADGKEVGPGGLSDGTRDQLYLALRVATIAHQATSGRPLPFVLDDVFVHFDDERARAGIEVLADLARSTQVLLFTHHARLVELAREALAADRLRVHDLDALRGRAPSLAEGAQAVTGDPGNR